MLPLKIGRLYHGAERSSRTCSFVLSITASQPYFDPMGRTEHVAHWHTSKTLYRLIKVRLIEIGAGRYTAHGLRASAACRVFEATGGDIGKTMAITGHTSEKTLRTYIQDANRERLGDEAIDAVQIMLDRQEAVRAARAA